MMAGINPRRRNASPVTVVRGAKWHLVVVVHRGAAVDSNVEGLNQREERRNSVRDLSVRDLLAVDLQNTEAAWVRQRELQAGDQAPRLLWRSARGSRHAGARSAAKRSVRVCFSPLTETDTVLRLSVRAWSWRPRSEDDPGGCAQSAQHADSTAARSPASGARRPRNRRTCNWVLVAGREAHDRAAGSAFST